MKNKKAGSVHAFIVIYFLLFMGQSIAAPPEWAREAVWYQIYPERFRNGDRGNDPQREDILSGWPYRASETWQVHPWTSDWYHLESWERDVSDDFYINAGARRYGGDLQGVVDRLEYLKTLGITAIYFNPLFESPSHHKYDAAMYHHIDNNFGPEPAKDRLIWASENPADPEGWQWTSADSLFLQLIQKCHELNIRIIIDGVFNHVGYTFWAFQDVLQRQKESPYKNWFIIRAWDDPVTETDEFDYAGWNGVRELPEIREDENGPVQGYKEHIRAIVKRWMDPNGDGDPSDGIDGWRLDVAEKVNPNFWRTFRRWVKAINPDAYIVGEIWWEDWPRNKMFNAAPWLQGDMFDGVMNYRAGRALKQYIVDEESAISAYAFADSIRQIESDYGTEYVQACQNLISSHDVERLASQIVNPDRWIDHGGNPAQNMDFNVRKPNPQELKKQRLFMALMMMLPGAPMIYYGDEAGMWGGDDPDCRKPMVWSELNFETESSHPFGRKRPEDPVYFDNDLFFWYQKLIGLRTKYVALSQGTIIFNSDPAQENILIFDRILGEQHLRIVVNNSSEVLTYTLSLPENFSRIKNVLTGEVFAHMASGTVMTVNAYQLTVFELEQ